MPGSDCDSRSLGILPRRPVVAIWLLMDIPATTREIAAGRHTDVITARGKSGPISPDGWRHGINDYTKWFSSDARLVAPESETFEPHFFVCRVT